MKSSSSRLKLEHIEELAAIPTEVEDQSLLAPKWPSKVQILAKLDIYKVAI